MIKDKLCPKVVILFAVLPLLFFGTVFFSTPINASQQGNYNSAERSDVSTKELFSECKESVANSTNFNKSFCVGFVMGVARGMFIGGSEAISVLNSADQDIVNSQLSKRFCLTPDLSTNDLITGFIAFVEKIPASEQRESFMRQSGAASFYLYLKKEFPCH